MPSILICEPQADLEEAINEFLVAGGATVCLERNGLGALACLRQQVFDVVVMEVALSSLDGLEVIRAFRVAGGRTPILILTGRISEAELAHAFDAGATAHLEKPFSLGDLLTQLTMILSESIAEAQLLR